MLRLIVILLLVIWMALPAAAAGEDAMANAREASAALQRGNVEQAVEYYGKALKDATLTVDRRATLYNDRGIAYQRLNQPRAAIEDFNRAVQLFPEGAAAYNNRGNVLLGLGIAKEAVKDFDRALLLAPGYAAAYSNRASAYAQLGDSAAALRDFSKAIQLNPANPAAFNGRGRLHLAQNRPYAAIRDFNRAVGFDARFGPGYRARAEAKLLLERYEEAVEDLSRAVAFDPSNLDLYLLRGRAYLGADNTASAIKDFDKAIELDAKSSAALELHGLASAKADAFEDALNDLGKALEIDPRSARAYAYRAWTYKEMGQPELGQPDIERAVRLEPGNAEVLWARGELLEATGDTTEAIADLRKALNLDPTLKDATAALERLGAGADLEEMELTQLGLEGWHVVVRNNRYRATSDEFPRLSVPLEMMGEGQPRLLEWEQKKPPLKGIGVLRFSAGTVEGAKGPEEVEHAAVLDLQARAVVAIETVRQGERVSNWTWEDNRLVVASLDGGTEEYPLRSRPQPQPAQRRVSGGGSGKSGDTPFWAPWAAPSDRGSRSERARSQPKSIFDLFFKKW